jgi:hypothetical protein
VAIIGDDPDQRFYCCQSCGRRRIRWPCCFRPAVDYGPAGQDLRVAFIVSLTIVWTPTFDRPFLEPSNRQRRTGHSVAIFALRYAHRSCDMLSEVAGGAAGRKVLPPGSRSVAYRKPILFHDGL